MKTSHKNTNFGAWFDYGVTGLVSVLLAVFAVIALSKTVSAKNDINSPLASDNNSAIELMGPVYPIQETDALVAIQNRMAAMEKSGELERMKEEVKSRIEGKILEPAPIEGVTTHTKAGVRYFDPTWTLPQDLYDDAGNVIAVKGTKVNPLEVMPVPNKMYFFDGRNRDQVELAKKLSAQYGSDFTPILTAGSWVDLSNELQQAVFFDQEGRMSTRMGITSVPALVSQADKLMKIEELVP